MILDHHVVEVVQEDIQEMVEMVDTVDNMQVVTLDGQVLEAVEEVDGLMVEKTMVVVEEE